MSEQIGERLNYLAAFPQWSEYEKMRALLEHLGLSYKTLTPEPGYGSVGCPVLIMTQAVRSRLASSPADSGICSGWIEFQSSTATVPEGLPTQFSEDIFGMASIMMLAPCIADESKMRLVAHISGDLTDVFPFLNAEMPEAIYNHDGQTLTFMEGYHMVTLFPRRIALARLDDIVDGWRILEKIRCRVNEVYGRRSSIAPMCTQRERPPVLEIYRKLPGTNCRRCGQKTCMAFAISLWNGQAQPFLCQPMFEGQNRHMVDDFMSMAARLGITADTVFSTA